MRKVLVLTYFQMRSRYRKTFAGFLWVVANPIIIFTVQAVVFKLILKINIDNYPKFLLAGLMPWYFISQTITSYASCLVISRELLLGYKINPFQIIGVQVIDNFFNYMIASLIIVLALITLSFISLSWFQVVLFCVNSLVLLIFVFMLTSLVSFLHVFYRDVQFVAAFIMNIAFFVTPIFYTVDHVDEKYRWIFNLNIFYPLIKLFQDSVYVYNMSNWLSGLLVCICAIVFIGTILIVLIKNKMKDFYINV